MLPGLDGTGLVFDPLLEHLPETIDPVIVRYPEDKVLSFQEHIDFARKQLPRNKPFVLLAESFSGPIGMQILGDPPKNMIGVIFVATFDRYPRPFLLDAALYLPQKLLLSLFTSTPLGRFLCLGTAAGKAPAVLRKALGCVGVETLSQRLKILATLPPPPETNDQTPCLYLQASHDLLVPERAAARLHKYLPQLQVKQLDGPHIILLAKPAEGAKAINAFIENLTGARCTN